MVLHETRRTGHGALLTLVQSRIYGGRRMSRTTCWYCGGELIWGGDVDIEEEDHYDIESNLTCSSCDALVLYYIKVDSGKKEE